VTLSCGPAYMCAAESFTLNPCSART